MMKIITKILLILILFSTIIFSSVYAYSDELFKFDLPSTYGNMIYQNMYVFADSVNSGRGMIIYTYEDKRTKKIYLES